MRVIEVIKDICDKEGIDYKFCYAVAMVESNASPFSQYDYPTVRFEKHVFMKYIMKNNPSKAVSASAVIGSNYITYLKACNVDKHSAMLATSYGMFQIMGFNYKTVGYNTVEAFVEAMKGSVEAQVKAFIQFVKKNNLGKAIREKNFKAFARAYNGPAYEKNNYDSKLRKFYYGIKDV